MNASLWSFWTTAQPALAGLKAGDWALLIMLGASLLVLSALRENYLLVWTAGWALLVSSRLALVHGAALRIPARDVTAFVQAAFVAAAGLFAGAVLVYIRERNLLLPLAVASAIVAGFALEVSYRIILLTAAIALIRARKGRWEFWAWLLATCLLVQHLSWPPFTDGIPARLVVASDVLLALSMLLVAFGEARARTQRLRVLGALTDSIVRAQQQSGMMETALVELQRLTRSRAAWFRLIDGGQLVATHAVGVSQDFLREAGFADFTESASQILDRGTPVATHRAGASPEDAGLLKSERIHYVVMTPVLGKKAPIGLLVLGSARNRR